jgi:hypothetical protein
MNCFLIATEDSVLFSTESGLIIEKEESTCEIVITIPTVTSIPKVAKPYYSFNRKNGGKYNDENPLKYNSLLSD